MSFLLLLLIVVFTNAQDSPFNCGAHGYCYPSNRTSATTCSLCICADGTTKVSATECEYPNRPKSCTPSPCTLSNQQCNMDDSIPTCTCAPGYTGTDCTMLTSDPCSPQPCLQNGVCTSSGGKYTCVCQVGFYGEQCQYSGTPCDGYCQNGGTCKLEFKGKKPFCTCPFDYYGQHCETARVVMFTYVGCFDDKSANFTDYYGFSTTLSTGSGCRDALKSYRKDNPTSTFNYATMSGTQKKCMFSTKNILTSAPTATGTVMGFGSISTASCATSNVNVGMASVYSFIDPCGGEDCGEANGYGKCVQTGTRTYICECIPGRYGDFCSKTFQNDSCNEVDCGSGTCGETDDTYGYYCACANTNQTGPCAADPCSKKPCLYGGTCNDLGNGSYTCDCLNLYTNTKCQTFNPCYINKCENGGTCVASYDLLDSTYTCECTPDWKGTHCEIERFYCDETTCANNGTCEDIIGPPNDYNCTCTPQWEGRNCTIDVNECLKNPTLCSTRDIYSKCVNTNGSFHCVCSPEMYGKLCHFNKMVYEILNATYGSMGEDELETMVNELTKDPTLVQDIVPFLIGGYSLETRKNLSWTADDMFLWVAYEEKLIDLEKNFYMWNDKVLGNCFTFNHMNSTFQYKARSPGYAGGLEMQMSLKRNEYLPWIETAAIMVFAATKMEAVTSESVRVNSAPHFESRIAINRRDYIRLGGIYGECIRSLEEVGSYYYEGEYTTDGCIRSCYQDIVNEACKCMDPKYPMPENALSCNMTKKSCIDDLVERRGDPSQWEECVCPLPCIQSAYTSKLSRVPISAMLADCEVRNRIENKKCYKIRQDSVLLRIALPRLDYLIYREVPLMDFNKFLSYLGGLLSVLIGVSVVSFIELFLLIIQILVIFIWNRKF